MILYDCTCVVYNIHVYNLVVNIIIDLIFLVCPLQKTAGTLVSQLTVEYTLPLIVEAPTHQARWFSSSVWMDII